METDSSLSRWHNLEIGVFRFVVVVIIVAVAVAGDVAAADIFMAGSALSLSG